MATSSGPGVVSSGLVFAYDMANREKSFLGAPATNTCSFGSYNYVWGNGVVTRNTTAPVPPPITGYEIAKLQSTDGNDTQTILYTAGVDQVNGGLIYDWEGGGSYWSGSIAAVKLYSIALSPAEIQQNFNALRGRYGI